MKCLILLSLLITTQAWAGKYFDNVNISNQLAVGTASAPDSSAALEIRSTTKGLLLPRMTTAERNAIAAPADGLVVFNTDTNSIDLYDAGSFSTISTGSFAGTIDASTQLTNLVPIANGGTNKGTWTANAIVYASGANTLSEDSSYLSYNGGAKTLSAPQLLVNHPTVNTTNFVAEAITPVGTASSSVSGLYIDLNNVNSPVKESIRTTSGSVNMTSTTSMPNTTPLFTDNEYYSNVNIGAGSPITGTSFIATAHQGQFSFLDDMDGGAIGFGYAHIGINPALKGAAGKTAADVNMLEIVPLIAATSAGGTTSDLSWIRMEAPVSLGGTLTVTRTNGINAGSTFCASSPANCYFLRSGDSRAKVSLAGDVIISGLTPSMPVTTDGNSKLVSTAIGLGGAQVSGSLPVNKLVAQTTLKAAAFDASGFLAPATTTLAELNFLSGATSNIQAQITAITTASGAISQLTGDVTAGPASGSAAATVALVGGKSAAAVATAVTDVQAASSPATANTIVKRDSSGNASFAQVVASTAKVTSLSTGIGHLDASGNLSSSAVVLSGAEVSGVLPAVNVASIPLTSGISGVLPVQNGGTNKASWNIGDIVFASTSTTLAGVPGGGSIGDVLTKLGTASYGFTTPSAGSSGWLAKVNIDAASGQVALGSGSQTGWTELTKSNLTLSNASFALTSQIPCASGTASSGVNCDSAAVNESLGIVFTPTTSCMVEVCSSFSHNLICGTGAAADCLATATFQIMETSNTSSTPTAVGGEPVWSVLEASKNGTASTDITHPVRLCGYFAGGISKRTFRLMYKKDVDAASPNNNVITFVDPTTSGADVSFAARCAN